MTMHPDDPQHAGSCHLMKEGHWTGCTVSNLVVSSCPGCTCGALSAWAEKNIPEIAEKRMREPILGELICPECGMVLGGTPHSAERCDTAVFHRESLDLLRAIHDKLDTLVRTS